ncbi:MAG: ATP-binding cassette domain-containing protein [Acidobacteriota bacterium]
MTLSVSDLTVSLDGRPVLSDITLRVESGEVFGFFGASGSGKSVLLRAVSGELSPDRGEITAVSPEFPAEPSGGGLFGWLKHNRTRADATGKIRFETVRDAAETASGVLLLDDPFRGMDGAQRAASIDTLRRNARERGVTVIIASSDYSEMLAACDQVVVLDAGRMIQIGSPRSVYDEPQTASSASLTGPNNIFQARRLSSSKSELPEFQTIDGEHRIFARRPEGRDLGPLNQNISLAIRPEQISISFGASFPEDNLLKADLTAITFQGPTTLLSLNAGGLTLDALVPRVVGLEIGSECMLGLPPDRIQVFRN